MPYQPPTGWVEGTFQLDSVDAVALDVLSLGPDVEVLARPELRDRVVELARATADRHRAPAP